MAFLLTEFTILPNNLLWFYNKLFKNQKGVIYQFLVCLRVFSFLLCRLPIAPWVILHAIKTNQLKVLFKEPFLIWFGCTFNTLLIGGLNLFWFYKLLQTLLK